MNAADYLVAWAIIRSWKAEGARKDMLQSAKDADRLPFVTVALIRIAALLAHASEVDRDFTQQLVYANDANIVTRILSVTDQILSAIDADQRPSAEALMAQLDAIPEHLAFRDIVTSEVEVDT
uniref:Uncharacterized protein n=1 Tax=Mycobacterium sp. (strain JLS) TaxID=164757 RepID=A0A5Q5CLP3_MYCSJ